MPDVNTLEVFRGFRIRQGFDWLKIRRFASFRLFSAYVTLRACVPYRILISTPNPMHDVRNGFMFELIESHRRLINTLYCRQCLARLEDREPLL
jgi:hypothetical protein